jgi:hypothetical protein
MKALICVLWAVNRLSAYGKMTGHINACIFWRDLTARYCLRRQLARLSIVRITRWPNVRHRLSADSSVSSPSRAFPAATVTAFTSANGFPFLRTNRRMGSLPSLCFFSLAFASVHNVNDHFFFSSVASLFDSDNSTTDKFLDFAVGEHPLNLVPRI